MTSFQDTPRESEAEMTRSGETTIRRRLLLTAGLCVIAVLPSCKAFAQFGALLVTEVLFDGGDPTASCAPAPSYYYYEPSKIEGHIWSYTGKN